VARTPLRKGEKLRETIEAQLAAIKKAPQVVRTFFLAQNVAYITDGGVISASSVSNTDGGKAYIRHFWGCTTYVEDGGRDVCAADAAGF
jgi:hypothetical protein